MFRTLSACMLLLIAGSAYAAPPTGSRWDVVGHGVLQDNSTGLQWTQRDNRSNIDQAGAKQWCDTLAVAGGGWRLPQADELQQIVDGSEGTTPCNGLTCKLPRPFHVTGNFAWTADSSPMGARRVNLITGDSGQAAPSEATYSRAICVRSPSSEEAPAAAPEDDGGADQPAAAPAAGRWNRADRGVLQDNSTGLQWTRSDNGSNVSQSSAKAWCDGLALAGGGWRLPNADQLRALVADGSGDTNRCGNLIPCKVSPLFHITEYRFWSASRAKDVFGKQQGLIVSLTDGKRSPWSVDFPNRAMCVRSTAR